MTRITATTASMGSGYTGINKSISEINYIKQYCGGKYTNFKLEPCYLEQTAWYDNTYYVDDERQLAIEDSFYIGD